MFIKSIKLKNFKSFKNANISFNPGYNCIVGPNGSGKSNVVDSILFALNEGSIRRLRVKKVNDLIFKSARIGEVEVNFDDGNTIVRAIRSDGKVKYILNGKTSKKYAVDEFLSKNSLSSNNVIQQGQVQHIVEISSKERRMIIDELSNISEFESKKREALGELQKVEDKLNEASAIFSEREGFMRELEKEKKDAEKYLDFKKRFESAKASILNHDIIDCEKEFDSISREIFSFSEKVSKIHGEISALELSIKDRQKEREELHNQIMQRSSGKQVLLQKEIDELNNGISKSETVIEEKHKDLEKLKLRFEELKKELVRNEDEKKGASERLKEVSGEVASLGVQIKEEDAKLEEVLKTSSNFSKEFQNARQEIEKINGEMLQCKDDLGLVQVEVSKIKEAQILKEKELNRLKIGNFEDFSQKKDELKLAKQEYIEKIAEDEKELARLFDDERKANKKISAIEEQLLYLREKVTILQSKLKGVREDGNAAQEIAMEVKGIFGTVSQLCEYDSDFAVPIQIAMGARANYLVAENVRAVQEAVDLLKKAGKLRASFIPLDKIRNSRITDEEKMLAKSSSSKGFILNKLKFDSKFQKAFEYVCGSTIITTALSESKDLIGKIRFATLQGEMSEASGVISGGAIPDRANALKDRADLEKFEKELNELKADKNALVLQLETGREESSQKRKSKAEFEIKKRTIELEEENISKIEKDQLDKKKDLKSAIDTLQSEIDAMQGEISNQDSKRMEMIRKLSHLNIKYLENKQKIDFEKEEKFGIAVKEREKKVSDLKITFASLRSREEAVKKEFQIYDKQCLATKKEIEQSENDEKEGKRITAESKAQIIVFKQTKKEREEELKSISQALSDLFDKRDEIDKELQVLGNSKGKFEFERERLEKENSSKLVKKAVVETNLANLKAEIGQYKDVQIQHKEKHILLLEVKECEVELEKIGNVNLKAIEMYQIKLDEFNEQKARVEQLRQEKGVVLNMITEIEGKKISTFMETYNTVNKNFAKLFATIFNGKGTLFLENAQSPFEGGLTIQVQLENKEVKYLELMSGGEKSLIALIFIFSIQACNPSTVYVLDEADAALDQENSMKLSLLLRELAKDSQFVVISHNSTVYKTSPTLIGVAMHSQESQIVQVNLEKFIAQVEAEEPKNGGTPGSNPSSEGQAPKESLEGQRAERQKKAKSDAMHGANGKTATMEVA